MPLPLVRTVPELRAVVAAWRAAGLKVGFVPTMGALHAGHVSLVELLKRQCDRCVASVFVNPKQFAAGEDLDLYPRDEAGDAAKLAAGGCDLLYAPSRADIYPTGFATSVSVAGVSEGLESAARPHFFGGVATVVAKLLIQCAPDAAAFGEKDYQQLLVVKRLVADLDLPVEVVAGPIVREPDGLAMSSRNAYLSPTQRGVAAALFAALSAARRDMLDGRDVPAALQDAERAVLAAGFDRVDYLVLRDAETLEPVDSLSRSARLLATARLGGVRLLDNLAVTRGEAP